MGPFAEEALPRDDETAEEEIEAGEELWTVDPVRAAEAAGLYYVMDGEPGFTRRQRGKNFVYLDERGRRVADPETLERIQKLVVPPAWTNVWICCWPTGHIQATGRDQKGRKQYRYHADWNALRSQTKFHRMVAFGEALPSIRARVAEDLRRPGLSRDKVTALVISLLERTMIRVGNQEYARQNQSYGLTTLLDNHIQVSGSTIRMAFVNKRGKPFDMDVRSRRLANLVKRVQDLPGQRLFQYLDEHGQCCQAISSNDVNQYLRDATGQDFTAKNFRTWCGTVLAAVELYALGPARLAVVQEDGGEDTPPEQGLPAVERAAEKRIVQVVKTVAQALNNTPTIRRKYYIHPVVLDAYRDESLFEVMSRAFEAQSVPAGNGAEKAQPENALAVEEQAVLRLLKMRENASPAPANDPPVENQPPAGRRGNQAKK